MSKPAHQPPEPVVVQARHDVIQDRLKRYIIANRLKPGDRLPTEGVLSEQLKVSRSALREALRSMEAQGIIAAQQGVGRVVLPFSFEPLLNNLAYGFFFQNHSVLQFTELRKALDAYFIEFAISNLSEADLATLTELVRRMRVQTEAGKDIQQEDYEFHRLLFLRCGNKLAYELFEIAWKVRLAALSQTLAVAETPPGTYLEHKELLDAIVARDIERARRIIVAHHWNAEQRFRQAIESGMSDQVPDERR